MKHKNVGQEEVAINGRYAMQPFFLRGMMRLRRQKQLFKSVVDISQFAYSSYKNAICLVLVGKHIDLLYQRPRRSTFCSLMQNKTSQSKLKRYELFPFGPTISKSEDVLETLISCLRFYRIYFCVLIGGGGHKHNNNLRYVSKLFQFHVFIFSLSFFFFYVCMP